MLAWPFVPIIEREGEGEKRPGIHCTGDSSCICSGMCAQPNRKFVVSIG